MSAGDTYYRTLIDACYIVGDETVLAQRVGYALPMVLDWLMCTKPVPVDVFLKAVDIVLSHSQRHVLNTDVFLDEVRRRNNLAPREGRGIETSGRTGVDHFHDIFLWPDAFWCFREEYSRDSLRGADYRVVSKDSEEWKSITDTPVRK